MDLLAEFFRRLRTLFNGRRLHSDLDEEMRLHIELRAQQHAASGLPADEARRVAHLSFGNPTLVREQSHLAWGWGWLETLLQDVRFALRQLWKSPGFTITAVLTLALGIGANTAIFTLVHAILLKDLPVADPKSLVRVGNYQDCCILNEISSSRNDSYSIFPYETYKYLRDHTPEFEQLAAMQGGLADLSARRASGDGVSHSSFGEFVSGNYFDTFGVKPFAGRALTPADDDTGAAPVAMLSYQAWQRDYAGDPSIIGSSFFMNTHPITIVGVTPPGFYGDRLSENPPDFYLPISQEPTLGFYSARNKPQLGWLFLVGRVKPGVAMGSLQQKMSGLLRQSLGELEDFQTVRGKQLLAKAHVVLTPGRAGCRQPATACCQQPVSASRARRLGAADCLCKHREPDAGARTRQTSGDLDSHGAWRGQGESDSANVDGESCAGFARRCFRPAAGLRRRKAVVRTHVFECRSGAGSRHAVIAGAWLCPCGLPGHRLGLWRRSGVDRFQ